MTKMCKVLANTSARGRVLPAFAGSAASYNNMLAEAAVGL